MWRIQRGKSYSMVNKRIRSREQRTANLHQELQQIKSQLMRDKNEGEKMAVRMDMVEQTIVLHQDDLNRQKNVSKYLLKDVLELKEARLKSKASDIKSMKKLDSISGKLASLEKSHEELEAKLADTGGASGSRGNARKGTGVQLEKRPCRICGRLYSAKYLRRAYHEQTKRCKKAGDATAALNDPAPEVPCAVLEIRTLDGTLLYRRDDEIPDDPQIE